VEFWVNFADFASFLDFGDFPADKQRRSMKPTSAHEVPDAASSVSRCAPLRRSGLPFK
jgi:hypothetical protein